MSLKIIPLISLLLFSYQIVCAQVGDYGESSNSQVGIVTNTVQTSTINAKCQESEPVTSCISKPTCCHVTNGFGSYTYSACVDIQNNNYLEFCKNFYELNAKEGFHSVECTCNNYFHIAASFIQLRYSLLVIVLFSILF